MSRRVAFYVQHLLGIGHVMRARRIAEALAAQGGELRLIMGGVPVPGLIPEHLQVVQLPPVAAGPEGFTSLVDEHGVAIDDGYKTRRRDLLLQAVEDFRPDVLVTEAFPFGRRQVRFELLPLLEHLHGLGAARPLIACSVRDILQEKSKPGRDQETVDILNRFYNLVLVHGDKRFVTLAQTFPLADRIAAQICYTGIVAPAAPEGPPSRRFDIVVSAGGGAVGRELMQAGLGAAKDARLADCTMLLLTGPGIAAHDYDALCAAAPDNVTIERFVADLPGLLKGCRLSISQAGYNTIADILVAGCRAILVPFAKGGESEQTRRAGFLAARGRALMLGEDELAPGSIADAVVRALEDTVAHLDIDTGGAAASAAILLEGAAAQSI